MKKVRLLPDALASQVAAGEVVERPSSVVKELVENSIDAGATKIEIMIQRGGVSLIRVVDDGHGMSREDALLSLERHATSKIRTKEDLGAIATLGFRGEALPSIASVSRFSLKTREKEALAGTEIAVEGGKMGEVIDSGEAPGTQMEVRSLFYNVPARRKFLRAENTEFSHIEQQVRVQAIAHPEITFYLIRDGRTVFQLPATMSRRERIRAIAGDDVNRRLVEIPEVTQDGVTVSGFVGQPGFGRSSRQAQLAFLNGRPVESPVITHALRAAYHTAMPRGQYPVTFLFIEIDPGAVDVNVHPAKREVRFHDGRVVQQALADIVYAVLYQKEATAQVSDPQPLGERVVPTSSRVSPEAALELPSREDPKPAGLSEIDRPEPTALTEPPPQPAPPDFRFLAVLRQEYVLLESEEGLVLLDQRSAHERILFEEMRRNMGEKGVSSQQLLLPVTVELDPMDFDFVSQNQEGIGRAGFGIEAFGKNTIKIDAVPSICPATDTEALLERLIAALREAVDDRSARRLTDDAIATMVSYYAVPEKFALAEAEIVSLVKSLMACEMPYCCPRGKPTLVQISYPELAKRFGKR